MGQNQELGARADAEDGDGDGHRPRVQGYFRAGRRAGVQSVLLLRNFPEWEGGTVVAVVPTLSGYPISLGSAFARYQIQIKVTYRVAG